MLQCFFEKFFISSNVSPSVSHVSTSEKMFLNFGDFGIVTFFDEKLFFINLGTLVFSSRKKLFWRPRLFWLRYFCSIESYENILEATLRISIRVCSFGTFSGVSTLGVSVFFSFHLNTFTIC